MATTEGFELPASGSQGVVATDDSARRAWLTGARGYPTDLGQALPSHIRDAQKRNLLATYPHLESWFERNDVEGSSPLRLMKKGSPHDLDASRQITRWAHQ